MVPWLQIISVAKFGDLSWIWLLLTSFGYQNFLFGYLSFGYFFGYFWKFGQKLVLNRFWLFLFVLWCIYFCLLKELWCRYFGFSQVLWCRSVGFFKNLATFGLYFPATLQIITIPVGIPREHGPGTYWIQSTKIKCGKFEFEYFWRFRSPRMAFKDWSIILTYWQEVTNKSTVCFTIY